jgi:hypothetical protein
VLFRVRGNLFCLPYIGEFIPYLLPVLMCRPLQQYLCFADNATDTVLLHVSSSNERQETRNLKVAMKKTTDRNIETHNDACNTSFLYFYTLEHLVVQVT